LAGGGKKKGCGREIGREAGGIPQRRRGKQRREGEKVLTKRFSSWKNKKVVHHRGCTMKGGGEAGEEKSPQWEKEFFSITKERSLSVSGRVLFEYKRRPDGNS